MSVLLFAAEFCLSAIVVGIAYVAPKSGVRGFRVVEHWFSRLARNPRLCVVIVGLAALAGRLAVLPILPIPYPIVHDEFSHLLAADTFAHGRLTNPTHPLWLHFESFHILQQPTYASMYFPLQGLLLAAGQVLFGHPFWGVMIGVCVMCSAICWMLQGWMPGKWALLGSVFVVIRLAVFSYWANSYYGGALPAIGGALVMGALPRLKRKPTAGMALLIAVGLLIFAGTRPFEGLFFGLPVAVALAIWILGRKSPPFRVSFRRVVVPIGLTLAAGAVLLACYFWRVTGSPLVIPYQVAMQTYGLRYFPWQDPNPLPSFHHAAMAGFYADFSLGQYYEAIAHPYVKAVLSLALPWLFFAGPLLTLPVLVAVFTSSGRRFWKLPGRKTLFLGAVLLVSSLAWILPVYVPQAHYAAASTAVFYAIVLQSMRALSSRGRSGGASGRTLVFGMSAAAVVLLCLRVAAPLLGVPANLRNPRHEFIPTWCSPRPDLPERARAEALLQALPGKQLVIVRYGTQHDAMFHEWVYNAANIDEAQIVWAREMSPLESDALISYFSHRRVWLAEPDEIPPRLSPYR